MKAASIWVLMLILAIFLCGCAEDNNNDFDYVTDYTADYTVNDQTTVEAPQEQHNISGSLYSGILHEQFGFRSLSAEEFAGRYGEYDSINVGERAASITQGKDRFWFDGSGLYFASISSDTFIGPSGVRCDMELKTAIELLIPDYAENFEYENEVFYSIYGESQYDEFTGIKLVSPYGVFYRISVEEATPDATYVLEFSGESDYGTETISFYFSDNKILTAYSMQLI